MSGYTTISLTSIPPSICRNLADKDALHDERSQQLSKHLQQHYLSQKKILEKKFSTWLEDTNVKLLQDVKSFINDTIFPSNKMSFSNPFDGLIRMASVVLGYQQGDHIPTIDMIERTIEAAFNGLKIIRISSNMQRKNDVVDILDVVRGFSTLVMIVEKTELLDISLIESFVSALYDLQHKNKNGSAKKVMILFCMSGSYFGLGRLQSSSIMPRISRSTTITKEPLDLAGDLKKRLLETQDVELKLSPNLIDLIYTNFVDRDCSVSNLKYLIKCAMFQHYRKRSSAFTLPHDKLIHLLDRNNSLFKDFQQATDKASTLTDENASSIASYCSEKVKYLIENHIYICHQIHMYFDLLRDETGLNFPSGVEEIYRELFRHRDLGGSTEAFNAIAKLSKYPADRILKRIEVTLNNQPVERNKSRKEQDLKRILKSFKGKLENNADSDEIVRDLIKALHKHASNLRSPKVEEMHAVIYCDDVLIVRERAIPSARAEALQQLRTFHKSRYSILYSIVHQSPEELNVADLFDEFKQKIEESQQVVNDEHDHQRSLRRSRANSTKKMNFPVHGEDGLLKAEFYDLLECMEYQGLIKQETRTSKRGMLKRVVWL